MKYFILDFDLLYNLYNTDLAVDYKLSRIDAIEYMIDSIVADLMYKVATFVADDKFYVEATDFSFDRLNHLRQDLVSKLNIVQVSNVC